MCVQVNIPLSTLGAPVLMGVALNHTSAGRPSAEFYVRYTFISLYTTNCSTVLSAVESVIEMKETVSSQE